MCYRLEQIYHNINETINILVAVESLLYDGVLMIFLGSFDDLLGVETIRYVSMTLT